MNRDKLWEEYKRKRNNEARERLILTYLPLVKKISGRLAVRLPHSVSQEDLEGYGIIGLIESIEKYDPNHGVSFENFAYRRIRGAMIDEVRKQFWLPRTLWHKLQRVNAERERLRKIHGDNLTDEQVAAALNINITDLHKLANYYNQLNIHSLDETYTAADGEPVRWGDLLSDPVGSDPLDVIEQQDGKRILVEAVDALTEKDRLILALYYQENLTLKEIGSVLEVSESRVSQLHTRAMSRLRQKLKEMF
ncbi:FliA/WhiG family RNA polymerase sigma factor [Desulfolucanica intricata]|uniref:FliA/WhiG family RNA polymerase sigma factor n=1 Tax=Desulfolucanica intricata TaxID=1285191 RepID=UPI000836FF7D|nr:FliA/WhiG family RNA polymerase sigma factor [Desulfolucanica intricata]